jgi:ribosomal protein S18 acetylase RimI-like enzyme
MPGRGNLIGMTAHPRDVSIVSYDARHRADFERLNREWIERYFVMEPADHAYLGDPETHILAPGGDIFFALAGGEALGTCAVVPHGPGVYELSKMAVAPYAQGRGIGDLLVRRAIAFARSAGARTLMLVSSRRLEPALRLYRRHGFREVPLAPDEDYVRADIRMELALDP